MKKFLQTPWSAAMVTATFFLVIMSGVAVMAKGMIDSRFEEASKAGKANAHANERTATTTEPLTQTSTATTTEPVTPKSTATTTEPVTRASRRCADPLGITRNALCACEKFGYQYYHYR